MADRKHFNKDNERDETDKTDTLSPHPSIAIG